MFKPKPLSVNTLCEHFVRYVNICISLSRDFSFFASFPRASRPTVAIKPIAPYRVFSSSIVSDKYPTRIIHFRRNVDRVDEDREGKTKGRRALLKFLNGTARRTIYIYIYIHRAQDASFAVRKNQKTTLSSISVRRPVWFF